MNYWHRLVQLSRKSGIHTRLIVSFLLISILPLGITGIIAYNKSNQAISSKTSNYSSQILQLLKNNISDEVRNYESFADQIMLNKEVQGGLVNFDKMSEIERSSLQVYIDQSFVGNNFWILSTIKSLQIQLADGRVLYDFGYNTLKDQDIGRLKESAQNNSQIDTWTYGTTIGGESCLALMRRIPNLDGAEGTLGYLIVGIDENIFSQMAYSDINLGEDSQLVLMNGSGEILSSKSDLFRNGDNISKSNSLRTWMKSEQTTGNLDIASKRYFASYVHDEALNWYLIGLIPFTYLDAESKDIALTIILVIVVCLIFALIFTTIITTSISSPLRKLNNATVRVMDGNFKTIIFDEGQDEIGHLSGKFNEMIQELDQLIDKVKVEQANKREAELKMLQAQINPHFLFNTLNSLKWAAMLSQADSVSEGLGALAELLRNTIVHKDEQVTLGDEIHNISNYIVIQQVRYGTSLQMQYLIPEELMNAHVLKFLLQPIVENAIIHGLEGLNREPMITISAERIQNDIQIVVSDNGKGITKEKLQQLLDFDAKPSTNRLANIGISNVRERIQLHYGDIYGLDITSEPDRGTDIVITIPYISTKGE